MNGTKKTMVAAAGPLSAVATSAGAKEACTVPAGLAGFAHPAAVAAAIGAVLVPNRAVRLKLARDARLPVTPEKAPPPAAMAACCR